MKMIDMMRSTVIAEATFWVQSRWLALPSWKRQRLKNYPQNWANCVLLSFLYIKVNLKVLFKKVN